MERKWMKWGIVGLLTFSLVTGCGGGGTDESQGDSGDSGAAETATADGAAAEEIYNNNCMGCHGGNLEGGAGPALDTIGATLSKDDIADVIKNGKGQMPAQKQLSDDDVDTLAEWLAAKK